MTHGRKIAVIGLAMSDCRWAAFARAGVPVIGFDIDQRRIAELRAFHDRTHEVEAADLRHPSLSFTHDAKDLALSDFFIVTVPTPIDDARQPDLGAMFAASRTVGSVLKAGDIVVYESTVYRRAVEDDCVPILERTIRAEGRIGFQGRLFAGANQSGDKQHRFETITKVVSAQDAPTLDIVASVYGSVVTAGIHRAPSIKVAEAAKVIENTQRDLNIAFMNELSLIFQALNIDTGDAARCADQNGISCRFSRACRRALHRGRSYYLTYRAERAGYHRKSFSQDAVSMTAWVSGSRGECIRGLLRRKQWRRGYHSRPHLRKTCRIRAIPA